MHSHRSHILQQLAEGQISADEAASRLQPQPAFSLPPEVAARWLRVRVTDLHTDKAKVTVNLPMAWVAAGLKIGARYAPEVANINLSELLAELEAGTSGRLVEVENLDDGERVEIFVD
jgi:hypothetical protein